jgi:hypothetical protein
MLGAKRHSAKQNNAFCFFFWKKKNAIRSIDFSECWVQNDLLRSRTTLFASGKRRMRLAQLISWSVGCKTTFCEAEQRCLLLEKEECD